MFCTQSSRRKLVFYIEKRLTNHQLLHLPYIYIRAVFKIVMHSIGLGWETTAVKRETVEISRSEQNRQCFNPSFAVSPEKQHSYTFFSPTLNVQSIHHE